MKRDSAQKNQARFRYLRRSVSSYESVICRMSLDDQDLPLGHHYQPNILSYYRMKRFVKRTLARSPHPSALGCDVIIPTNSSIINELNSSHTHRNTPAMMMTSTACGPPRSPSPCDGVPPLVPPPAPTLHLACVRFLPA